MNKYFLFMLTILASVAARASAFDVCMEAAQNVLEWPDSTKIQNCLNLGPGFVDCLPQAQNVIEWSDGTQIMACHNAGAGFAECFAAADQSSTDLSLGSIINLCVTAN